MTLQLPVNQTGLFFLDKGTLYTDVSTEREIGPFNTSHGVSPAVPDLFPENSDYTNERGGPPALQLQTLHSHHRKLPVHIALF